MAGKAKSIYLSIAVKGDPFKIVAKQKFFTAKDMRVWVAEHAEEFPETKYRYTKEVY